MDINLYKKFLLSSIPSASIAGGGKVINCRCFFCPDSSNPSSKHFYISIPQNDDEPSLYYCHKCHCAGIVTYKKLIEWGIYDEGIAIDLINHNKKCSTKICNNKYFNRQIYKLMNGFIRNDNISVIKLNYINNRLGTNFNYTDLQRLKIVLNLKDLLSYNNVESYTRHGNIIDQLDINFIGFISIDNAFLNMRRICDEGLVYKNIDKRYVNYKIFDKFDTSERFYTIPTSININSPNRIKINIAEGPFDILSIYQNVRNRETGIYSAVGGSNYLGSVMYFLDTYKLPYTEFHIYPDNDKSGSNENMNKITQFLKPLNSKLYIHRNMYAGEKDFGVGKSKIKESIIELI